jgi:hypothetical protein
MRFDSLWRRMQRLMVMAQMQAPSALNNTITTMMPTVRSGQPSLKIESPSQSSSFATETCGRSWVSGADDYMAREWRGIGGKWERSGLAVVTSNDEEL